MDIFHQQSTVCACDVMRTSNSVCSPVCIGSAEGRHCGWGTSPLGMEWGLGCREEVHHLTELGALCMGYPLKCILKTRSKTQQRRDLVFY